MERVPTVSGTANLLDILDGGWTRACWEAERARIGKCIAVENYHCRLKLQLQQQVCGICDMRACAAMAVVEIKREATETDIAELRALIELAKRYLSRLFKTEHYQPSAWAGPCSKSQCPSNRQAKNSGYCPPFFFGFSSRRSSPPVSRTPAAYVTDNRWSRV